MKKENFMKKSYNTKKSLSMLPLLALALFNTSMYSMRVKPTMDLKVSITRVENTTNKNLTITIDKKDYTIKAGRKRKLNQEVAVQQINLGAVTFLEIKDGGIPIKHKGKRIVRVVIGGRTYPAELAKLADQGFINFMLFGEKKEPTDEYRFTIDEHRFTIKQGNSYDFSIQLTLKGENLEKSEIEVAAVER